MDAEKQREIVRLWNRIRRVDGPVAEEIRIQILECFAACEPVGRTNDRRAVIGRVIFLARSPSRAAQQRNLKPRGGTSGYACGRALRLARFGVGQDLIESPEGACCVNVLACAPSFQRLEVLPHEQRDVLRHP